ncbi:unnamed protein product [Rotaria sp. Silwood2]|nr:unnamed protein product [Rotaria sp. Silwood2]CAF4205054.1 unnamed protein product [Rotaria sp. Silwood2]
MNTSQPSFGISEPNPPGSSGGPPRPPEIPTLTNLQTGINYTINFYLHSLASPLRRQELMKILKWGREHTRVVPMTGAVATVKQPQAR